MPRAAALTLALLLIPAAVGCGEKGPPEPVKLTITGAVDREQALTWTDLSNLGWESLDLGRSDGPGRSYPGLRLGALLARAKVGDTATTITFIAADGDEHSLPLAEVLACADCALVSLMGRHLWAALPGFPDEAWVYNVVEVAIGE